MERRPVAYIRRSTKSRTDPGDISREFQTETVRRLAGEDANLVILDGDWGRSAAADATAKRLAFLDLLASIERGEVSTLYAYSTDRLARSVRWSAQLLDACESAGTTIVTSEGRFAPGDDMARQMFHFVAIGNEHYSRQAKTKRRATVERQRARGMRMGCPAYGDREGDSLPTIIETYRRMGSLSGTARELNRIGLPSRRGHWAHSSVQRILAREGLVPVTGSRGTKHRQPHIFARLLLCHCGHFLTGSTRSGGATLYRCIRGEAEIAHGRKSISETAILDWARQEVARLTPPPDRVLLSESTAQERHAITARLERAKRMYLDGDMDRAAFDLEKRAIGDELTRLDLQGQASEIPAFQWNHGPAELNLALRALWEYVELDAALQPVRAVWRLPDSWIARPIRESPVAPQD